MVRVILLLVLSFVLGYVSEIHASFKTRGEVGLESRIFDQDNLDQSQDSSITMVSRLETRYNAPYKNSTLEQRLRLFNRTDDADSSRDILMIEELWVGGIFDPFQIRIGAQMLNWTALEAFHPADIINSRNFDSNIENPEKFGEPMVSIAYQGSDGSASVFYMPMVMDPNFPGVRNRFNTSLGTELASAQWIEPSGVLSDDEFVHQYGARVDKTIGSSDISFHAIQHQDRSQPVIVVDSNSNIVPLFLPVTQFGGTFQSAINDLLIKSEFAYRDFKKSTGTSYGTIDQKDHFQIALGTEYTLYHDNDYESTFLVEGQTYEGVSESERAGLGLFQRDLLFGYRLALNDIDDTQLFTSFIVDAERRGEYVFSVSYERRIGDVWKAKGGFRLYEGEEASDGYGTQQYDQSDHLFLNVTRYF